MLQAATGARYSTVYLHRRWPGWLELRGITACLKDMQPGNLACIDVGKVLALHTYDMPGIVPHPSCFTSGSQCFDRMPQGPHIGLVPRKPRAPGVPYASCIGRNVRRPVLAALPSSLYPSFTQYMCCPSIRPAAVIWLGGDSVYTEAVTFPDAMLRPTNGFDGSFNQTSS